MFGKVIDKPLFRPPINVGGMLDVPTGHYELGAHGESILMGGVGPITGIASRPNNFKTALAIYMQAMIRRAFMTASGLIYDTEGTLSPMVRFQAIAAMYEALRDINWEEDDLFTFTDLSRYTGDHLMKLFRDTVHANQPVDRQLLEVPDQRSSGHVREEQGW